MEYRKSDMSLRFYNSKTRKKEPFEPASQTVRIYSCGPTVYNLNHIGNFRAYVFVDLLRRYLKYKGFCVEHTVNITDVEDKIIRNSLQSQQNIQDFTEKFIRFYLEDLSYLGVEEVEHRPRATESIAEMIEMIEALLAQGHAYEQDGNIYFRISSFEAYGQLSGIEPEALRAAADGRFEADEYDKEDVRDFALWKKSTPEDTEVRASWEAPFGRGRPGWHLECSAMIRKIYGKNGIDIHTGGIDLLFPHHENEIAQSCCTWPHENFVRYWLHNEHLLVEGKKMSKSLGNFFTLRELTRLNEAASLVDQGRAPESILDLIKSGRMPRAMRYMLLGTHYRQKLNFTFEGLSGAARTIERLESGILRALETLEILSEDFTKEAEDFLSQKTGTAGKFPKPSELYESPLACELALGFTEALDDDLNISRGLAALFEALKKMTALATKHADAKSREARLKLTELLFEFYRINRVLGVLDWKSLSKGTQGEDLLETLDLSERSRIEELIERRAQARKDKDFALADQIRDELLAEGIELKDGPEGTTWVKK